MSYSYLHVSDVWNPIILGSFLRIPGREKKLRIKKSLKNILPRRRFLLNSVVMINKLIKCDLQKLMLTRAN